MSLTRSSRPAVGRALPAASVALVVLDGWGLAASGPGNAVELAATPVFDELWEAYPHTELRADGRHVGLPAGQMGNSEVGHLNLGAGAVVRQDLTRIDDAVAAGALADNGVLRHALSASGRVHLIGLVSDGGVHSGWGHLEALIGLAGELGVGELVIHAFTDGRDTRPDSGVSYVEAVQGWCERAGSGRIASVVGRYFAMDRDRRWDRIQRAYDLLAHGRGDHHCASAAEALRAAYERGETDEFVSPTTVGREGAIRPTDSVLAFNFRPDRMREITRALADRACSEVDRHGAEVVRDYATLAEYEEGWPYPVAFAPQRPASTLAAVLAAIGARQLHVAETEKYAHVTYFFNGGRESPWTGEDRRLVDSPRDVATYDLKPAMSARAASEAFQAGWAQDRPRFGVINFANPDMVGHTGVIPAAVSAIETVDACLGDVVTAVHASGGVCVVTADHGNAEHMLEPDGSPNTAHSLNPVPLIVTVPAAQLAARGLVGGEPTASGLASGGVLADVAPTVLDLLGVAVPAAMTGRSLLRPSR